MHSFVGKLDDIRSPGNQEKPKSGGVSTGAACRVQGHGGAISNTLHWTLSAGNFVFSDSRRRTENGIITHFHLDTCDIDDAPPYFCLSYVWGGFVAVSRRQCQWGG